MGRCKNLGHRRWRVVKRDGVWQALDPDGDLRYAAEYHRMVMAFVMTQPKPQPTYYDALQVMKAMGAFESGAADTEQLSSWKEALRKAWEKQNKRDVWDVLSNPGDPEDYPEKDERESK